MKQIVSFYSGLAIASPSRSGDRDENETSGGNVGYSAITLILSDSDSSEDEKIVRIFMKFCKCVDFCPMHYLYNIVSLFYIATQDNVNKCLTCMPNILILLNIAIKFYRRVLFIM